MEVEKKVFVFVFPGGERSSFFLFGYAAQIDFVQIIGCGCLSPAIGSAEVSPSFLRFFVHMELRLFVLPFSWIMYLWKPRHHHNVEFRAKTTVKGASCCSEADDGETAGQWKRKLWCFFLTTERVNAPPGWPPSTLPIPPTYITTLSHVKWLSHTSRRSPGATFALFLSLSVLFACACVQFQRILDIITQPIKRPPVPSCRSNLATHTLLWYFFSPLTSKARPQVC